MCVNRVDEKRHVVYAVATVLAFKFGSERSGLGEHMFVPGERQLACAYCAVLGVVVCRHHKECHRVCAVALVLAHEGGVGCSSLIEGVFMPCVWQLAVADGVGLVEGVCRVDNECHIDCTIAVERRDQGVCLSPGLSEYYCVVVPVVGELVVADDACILNAIVCRIHNEFHSHDRVAAVNGCQCGDTVRCFVEYHSIPFVRQLGGTYFACLAFIVCRVDNEGQDKGAVAVVGRMEYHWVVCHRSRENAVVPFVAKFAVADGVVVVESEYLVYDECLFDNAVASKLGLQ